MWKNSRCHTCQFKRLIHNKRGSTFLLCERNKIDATFTKYPPQPVSICRGYEEKEVRDEG